MIDQETLNKLSEVSVEEWNIAIKKCYTHMWFKLYNKTTSGAHCSQRLGSEPFDFYLSNCIEGLHSGVWAWYHDRFSIDEQMIRIINSMISEQVRKYKVEVNKNSKTVLVENAHLIQSFDNEFEDEENDQEADELYMAKLNEALNLACEGNKQYKEFISLYKKNPDYEYVCDQLKVTKKQAYQIMETISRRAIKRLKSL